MACRTQMPCLSLTFGRLDAFAYDDGTFVTVLEFCGGTDLDQVLKRQGPLPEKDAKRVITQVREMCDGPPASPATPVTRLNRSCRLWRS